MGSSQPELLAELLPRRCLAGVELRERAGDVLARNEPAEPVDELEVFDGDEGSELAPVAGDDEPLLTVRHAVEEVRQVAPRIRHSDCRRFGHYSPSLVDLYILYKPT